MPAQKVTPIRTITEPLALRSAGDPEAFTRAAESNVQDMHDMGVDINSILIPAINAAVGPLNTLVDNLPAVQNAAGNATTATKKAAESAASAKAAADSATVAGTKATAAAGSATAANTDKTAAETAKTAAQAAESNALASKNAAAASATASAGSATTASTKAGEAAASASNAASSATAANTAKTGAEKAQIAAEAAKTNANISKIAAADSATAAAESAKQAADVVIEGIPDASTAVKGLVKYGTVAGTAAQGNDERLNNARTPVAHVHGGITSDGKVGTAAGKPLITGTGGAVQAGEFGTGAGTACAGNDSRLAFKGIITPFYGALGGTANKFPVVGGIVKTDWHVCDGTDGTPDLRDRFIVGASTAKAANSKAGAESHAHTITTTVSNHPATAISGGIAANSAAVAGSISSATAGVSSGTTGSTSAGGSVGATTLSTSQMPSHGHIHDLILINKNVSAGGEGVAVYKSGSTTYATGGSGAHTHSFSGTSHSHTVSVSDKGHSHGFSLSAASHAHGHSLSTQELGHSAASSAVAANTLPPYMALHYIMYIGA